MSDKNLLPCPFCGGEAKLIKHYIVALDVTYREVFCTSCCAKRPADKIFSEEEAIKFWNTRKPMERIVEQLEEEKEKGFYDYDSVIGEKNVWAKAIEIVKGGVDNAG